MTIIIKKDDGSIRQLRPYVKHCWAPNQIVLMPQQSITDTLFASFSKDGWQIADPGKYTIQIAIHLEKEDVLSNPLEIRVNPPRQEGRFYSSYLKGYQPVPERDPV